MRVALVYRNFYFGGSIERDTMLLARSLVAQGVEVHCYGDPVRRSAVADGLAFHDVRPSVRGASRFPSARAVDVCSPRDAPIKARSCPLRLGHVSGPSGWEHDVVTVHEVVRAGQRRWPARAGRGYRAAGLRVAAAPLLRPEIVVGRATQGAT
jgi:hypothetical protein